MAQRVKPIIFGIDTSKHSLDICPFGDKQAAFPVANHAKDIQAWLDTLPENVCLGIEATNTFHLELVEQAIKQGLDHSGSKTYDIIRQQLETALPDIISKAKRKESGKP